MIHDGDEEGHPAAVEEERDNSGENRNELVYMLRLDIPDVQLHGQLIELSLIHISEPTRPY